MANGNKKPIKDLPEDLDLILTGLQTEVNTSIDKVGAVYDTAIAALKELKEMRAIAERAVNAMDPLLLAIEEQVESVKSIETGGNFSFQKVFLATTHSRSMVNGVLADMRALHMKRQGPPVDQTLIGNLVDQNFKDLTPEDIKALTAEPKTEAKVPGWGEKAKGFMRGNNIGEEE